MSFRRQRALARTLENATLLTFYNHFAKKHHQVYRFTSLHITTITVNSLELAVSDTGIVNQYQYFSLSSISYHIRIILTRLSYRPHYASCPSVRPSVRLAYVDYGSGASSSPSDDCKLGLTTVRLSLL